MKRIRYFFISGKLILLLIFLITYTFPLPQNVYAASCNPGDQTQNGGPCTMNPDNCCKANSLVCHQEHSGAGFNISVCRTQAQLDFNSCSNSLQVTSATCGQNLGPVTVNINNDCSPAHTYRVCVYSLQAPEAQAFCEHGGTNTDQFIAENAKSNGTIISTNLALSKTAAATGDTWQAEVCECLDTNCSQYNCAGSPNQVMHININNNACTGPNPTNSVILSPPPPPCANQPNNGGCSSVNTALGLWSTDPAGFVKSLFSVLLSISGAIAVLIIMYAGYRMMMSQGDPEKLAAAREQLTAAIVGLLFLIFSLVILQIIGVDILGLPGFGSGNGGNGNPSRIDYGNDANPCANLTVTGGSGANCGMTSQGTGLFCAGTCGVGGLQDMLYKCIKSVNGFTTVPVKDCQSATNGICIGGMGANVPDYCGTAGTATGGH